MKPLFRSILLVALTVATLGAGLQGVSAAKPQKQLILYGTTGACNNAFSGGPCTQTSTLVQLDPQTGALIRVIGEVGYTVNGLAWDRKANVLYASTSVGDTTFHGLIKIDTGTGAGSPVDPTVHNFGLAGNAAPIHSITIHPSGQMVAWYDKFGGPTDSFVQIDKNTGIATEFPNTGINTSGNGLSFDQNGLLWNIDTPRGLAGALTQTAYLLNHKTGKPLASVSLSPPTTAALGDFNPVNNLYYGLDFVGFDPTGETFMVVVDLSTSHVTTLGQTVHFLHTLAFAYE